MCMCSINIKLKLPELFILTSFGLFMDMLRASSPIRLIHFSLSLFSTSLASICKNDMR